MARAGGSYIRDNDDGAPKKVAGTKDHPEGNRPRDMQGRPLGAPKPEQPKAAKVSTKPAAAPSTDAKK